MAKTTYRTWSLGEFVTAAMLNEQIRDNGNAIWVGTTKGDIDYYNSSTVKVRLPIGTSNQVLVVGAGGVPAWSSGYWTGTTAGDMEYYSSASAKTRIGIGSTGQYLRVVGGVPTWSTVSFVGVRVSASTAQNISPSTETKINAYGTTDYNTNSFYATGRITIPAGQNGYYMIGGGGNFVANTYNDRVRMVGIKKNGTYVVKNTTTQDTSSDSDNTDIWLSVATAVSLAVNDYLELWVEQKSEDTIEFNSGSLWATKVG